MIHVRNINRFLIFLAIFIALSSYTFADSINITYSNSIPIGNSGSFISNIIFRDDVMFVSSSGTDTLFVYNISNITNPIYMSNYTNLTQPYSTDAVRFLAADNERDTLYASANTGDALIIFNISNNTLTPISAWNTTASDNFNTANAVFFYQRNNDKLLFISTNSNIIKVYNVTNPSSIVKLSDRSAAANPCSTDTLGSIYFINNTNRFLITSITDDTVSLMSLENNGTITCITNYTDNTPSNSIDGADAIMYDPIEDLYYVTGMVDSSITAFNVTDTTITPVLSRASETDMIHYYTSGLVFFDAYLFYLNNQGYIISGYRANNPQNATLSILNITNRTTLTNIGNLSLPYCNVTGSQTISMTPYKNYLYISDYYTRYVCVIKLYDISTIDSGTIIWNYPTPDNNSVINWTSNIPINVSFNMSSLTNMSFSIEEDIFDIYENVIAWWNFNNVSAIGDNNTKVMDIGPNRKYNLILNLNTSSTLYNDTKNGMAIKFLGFTVDSSSVTDTRILFPNNHTVSFAFWIKSTKNTTGGYSYFLGDAGQNNVSGYTAMSIPSGTDSDIRIEYANGTAQYGTSIDCPVNLVIGQWRHVVIDMDYQNDIITCYADGELVLNASIPNAVELRTNRYYYIGDYSTNYRLNFSGSLDDVIIYNGLFTPKQAKHLYVSTLSKYTNNSYNYETSLYKVNATFTVYTLTITNSSGTNYYSPRSLNILSGIIFNFSTENNSYYRVGSNVTFNVTISNINNMSKLIMIINGTNYTLFNNSNVGMWNFDDNPELNSYINNNIDVGYYGRHYFSGTGLGSSNPIQVPGKFGGSYIVGKGYTPSSMTSPNTLNNSITTFTNRSFSIGMWYKPSENVSTVTTWSGIFTKAGGGSSNRTGYYLYWYNNTKNIGLEIWNNGSSDGITTPSNSINTIDRWYHVFATYNTDDKNMSIYLDGVLVNSDISVINGVGWNPTYDLNYLQIGSSGIIATYDEVRLYDRRLTPSEVLLEYKSYLRKTQIDSWSYTYNLENATIGNYSINFEAYDLYGNKNSTTISFIVADYPSIPTSLTCNGGSCNGTFNTNVSLVPNGSNTTITPKTITYYIEKGNYTSYSNVNLSYRYATQSENTSYKNTTDAVGYIQEMLAVGSWNTSTPNYTYWSQPLIVTSPGQEPNMNIKCDGISKWYEGNWKLGDTCQGSPVGIVTTTTNQFVYNTRWLGDTDYSFAYYQFYLYAPSSQTIRVRYDKDDVMNLWVNNIKYGLIDGVYPEGASADENYVDVVVLEGWNKFSIGQGNGGSAGGFYFKITTTGGTVLSGWNYTSTPPIAQTIVNNYTYTTIGNTTSAYNWNITNESNGEVYEMFRIRAVDNTSTYYSDYFYLPTNFNISNILVSLSCVYGSGITKIQFKMNTFDSFPQLVNVTGQTNTIPIFNCTNVGTSSAYLKMSRNVSLNFACYQEDPSDSNCNNGGTGGTSASYGTGVNATNFDDGNWDTWGWVASGTQAIWGESYTMNNIGYNATLQFKYGNAGTPTTVNISLNNSECFRTDTNAFFTTPNQFRPVVNYWYLSGTCAGYVACPSHNDSGSTYSYTNQPPANLKLYTWSFATATATDCRTYETGVFWLSNTTNGEYNNVSDICGITNSPNIILNNTYKNIDAGVMTSGSSVGIWCMRNYTQIPTEKKNVIYSIILE